MSSPPSQHLVSVPNVDEAEKYSISELLHLLKRSFRVKDFERVEWILKLREEKMSMAKQEAEMHAVHVEKELGIYKARCAELSVELEKKNKEIKDLELKKIEIEDDYEGYKRTCDELKETTKRLEEDCETICERERRAQKRIASLSDEIKNMSKGAQKFVELKMENRDLECAKRRAENEIEVWQKKFRELKTLFLQEPQVSSKVHVEPRGLCNKVSYEEDMKKVESRLSNIKNEAYSEINSACVSIMNVKEEVSNCALKEEVLNRGEKDYDSVSANLVFHPLVKGIRAQQVSESGAEHGVIRENQMKFELDESSHKKPFPPEPDRKTPTFESAIEISDSDSESEVKATLVEDISDKVVKRTCVTQNEDESKNCSKHFSVASTDKRKLAPKVVTNFQHSQDDHDSNDRRKIKALNELTFGVDYKSGSSDNQHCLFPTVSSWGDDGNEHLTLKRRRLVSLRQCEEKRGGHKQVPSDHLEIRCPTYKKSGNSTVWKDNEDETGVRLDCVGESLDECILAEFNGSGRDVNSTDPENVNNGITKFLGTFRRLKRTPVNWNYEADMVSSFEKDPLLCMKAVCALYRQHTIEEPSTKGSAYSSSRGFLKSDAARVTGLANFLMDGNRKGDMKKSVQDLEKYNPKGVEESKRLAKYYSKQLFTIYKNREDPFFLPANTGNESTK